MTWRREGTFTRGAAHEALTKSVCWPTAWLAPALPSVRLLSIEYGAPASGWEGENLSLEHTARQLADKLAAAGEHIWGVGASRDSLNFDLKLYTWGLGVWRVIRCFGSAGNWLKRICTGSVAVL